MEHETKIGNAKLIKRKELVKSLTRLGGDQPLIDYVLSVADKYEENRAELLLMIESHTKTALPTSQRKMEVVKVDSSTSKLTINPVTGRVIVKLSTRASDAVHNQLISFAFVVANDDTLPPLTVRGRFLFANGKYRIAMQTESKRFTRWYEIAASDL